MHTGDGAFDDAKVRRSCGPWSGPSSEVPHGQLPNFLPGQCRGEAPCEALRYPAPTITCA